MGVWIKACLLFAILISICALSPSPDPPGLYAAQPKSGPLSARLEEALRIGDLERAGELVIDDLDGADRLFLGYLEETIFRDQPDRGKIPLLEKARRLADVFFRIYEYDFERGIVTYWKRASVAQRQAFLPILRDHFAAYRQARAMSLRMPQPIETRIRLCNTCSALAARYRKVSFGKGELQALLLAESLGAGNSWKVWQLAKSLHDEVGEAWGAYYFGSWAGEGLAESAAQHAAESAERLRLPRLLQFALARLAWRALSRDDYAAHLDYLRQGLKTVRTIPVRQSMISRSGCDFYPGEAWYLKTLWRAYKLRNIPGAEKFFEQGRVMSRRVGGEAGELAYFMASLQEYVRPGVFEDVISLAEPLARRMADRGWLAAFLMAKARGLEGTREFPTAFAAIEEAAAIHKGRGDRYHLADCLEERALFWIQTNAFERARADYAEAIRVVDGLGFAEEAIILRIRAADALKSKPKSALKILSEALAMAEKIDAPGIIRSVYSCRAKILATDSPEQSLEDFKKELFYCERHRRNIGYPGEVPVAMRLVSRALRRVGKYSEAVEMEKRRAEFSRAEGLFNAQADASYELVNIYCFDLGEPGLAAEFAEKYARLLLRPGRRLSVNDYDRIAGTCLAIGQPGRALEYWAKALQLAKETPAGEHLERMLHINMARTSLVLGDYDAALAELEAEKALIERTFFAYREPLARAPYDSGGYASTLAELSASDGQAQRKFESYDDPIELQKALWLTRCALAHALSGDLDRAVRESREAIVLEFSTPSGTTLAYHDSYFLPGDALILAGKYDEASVYYKKRRDRAREVKSLPEERRALVRLGGAYARSGRIEEARRVLLEAVKIDRLPPGPQVGRLSESLLALGSLELRAGRLSTAEGYLVEASEMGNPYDLSQVWQVERALAEVSAALGKDGQAEGHYEPALSALEGGRERLRPEEFAIRFGMDRLQVYDEYASYLAGRAIETQNKIMSEKALQVIERRRAQALWDLMARGWAGLQPDAVPEQLQRARQAEARLAAKQGILRDEFNLPPQQRHPARIAQLEAELREVKREHARLLVALAQGKFRFSSPAALPAGLIPEARKKLGPDRVLVEYLVGERSTYAFVLSSAGLEAMRFPIGREELRKQVQGLLRPFYSLQSGEVDLARLDFDFTTAQGLYRRLVAPLEPRFGEASNILVVADDVLCYLPFELLVIAPPRKRGDGRVLFAECEQADFLVRRLTVSYLIAAAQLLGEGEPSAAGAEAQSLLAMADPLIQRDHGNPNWADPAGHRLHSPSSSGAFAPLPGSSDEVDRIRRCFSRAKTVVLTGSKATEERYKALSPRSAIVHLATHAIAADDQPFYSTLILAPGGRTQEDGFLHAYEIVRSPLRANLVVLSACETARGPLSRGEGLVGLVSAFLQAGARSVLATQWSIHESAAQFMPSFYKAMMGGQDKAEALRRAKLEFLKKRRRFGGVELSLAHPFFWAPFVLIGPSN